MIVYRTLGYFAAIRLYVRALRPPPPWIYQVPDISELQMTLRTHHKKMIKSKADLAHCIANIPLSINKRRWKAPHFTFSIHLNLFRFLSEGISHRQCVLYFRNVSMWSKDGEGGQYFSKSSKILNHWRGLVKPYW